MINTKRGYFIILVISLFVLAGCTDQQPSENDAPINTSHNAMEDSLPTVFDALEPTVFWQLEPPEYLDYDTYFSCTKTFDSGYKFGSCGWKISNNGSETFFRLSRCKEGLCIQEQPSGNVLYTIPNSKAYADYAWKACDSIYAYGFDDEGNLYQLELLTGNIKILYALEHHFPFLYLCDWRVLFFAGKEEEKLVFYRFYIPDLACDVMRINVPKETPDAWFFLIEPTDTDTLQWTTMNPEFIPVLKQILADGESPYRTTEWGKTIDYLWSSKSISDLPYNNAVLLLSWNIQDDYDVKPFLRGEYSYTKNTYSYALGIIDNCYFGTGNPEHDHYSDTTAIIKDGGLLKQSQIRKDALLIHKGAS